MASHHGNRGSSSSSSGSGSGSGSNHSSNTASNASNVIVPAGRPNPGYVNPLDKGAPAAPVTTASAPASAPSPAPSLSAMSTLAVDRVVADISRLTPEQCRTLAAAVTTNGSLSKLGLVGAGTIPEPTLLPDGSLRTVITIPPEVVEPLKSWAEASDNTLQQQIDIIAGQAVMDYVFGDWGARAVQAETGATAAGGDAGTGAGAGVQPPPAPLTPGAK